MIEFNGKQYSGTILKNDSEELVVSICTNDLIPDICLALNGVKAVTEITEAGSTVYNVNTATNISNTLKGIYAITFSKKLTIIQEMSNAIDELLLIALGGNNV